MVVARVLGDRMCMSFAGRNVIRIRFCIHTATRKLRTAACMVYLIALDFSNFRYFLLKTY